MPKTKIIATIGPSSRSASVLGQMIRRGLDVVRLNFSHATHEECAAVVKIVRKASRKILVLGDLEGHRIRIGRLKGGKPLFLKKGNIFWLTRDNGQLGRDGKASFDYEGPLSDIRPGHTIYIDDGLIALNVLSVSVRQGLLKTRILVDGVLRQFKGINIPGARLHFGGLSQKDRQDIAFAVSCGMDFLAQSFVRTARDLSEVKKELSFAGRRCRVVAKIENKEGIKNIASILKVSDGIMVARGDMGVSIPLQDVPFVQKEIIALCNRESKPVITATQMLERMVSERIPTRAEVSDIANAVLDGTDYVMLSAETAAGLYPVEAVDMMNKVIQAAERWKRCRGC
ncbi:MAG: pyruvate kinase [Candidatus Omnitrophota bacterium]